MKDQPICGDVTLPAAMIVPGSSSLTILAFTGVVRGFYLLIVLSLSDPVSHSHSLPTESKHHILIYVARSSHRETLVFIIHTPLPICVAGVVCRAPITADSATCSRHLLRFVGSMLVGCIFCFYIK